MLRKINSKNTDTQVHQSEQLSSSQAEQSSKSLPQRNNIALIIMDAVGFVIIVTLVSYFFCYVNKKARYGATQNNWVRSNW